MAQFYMYVSTTVCLLQHYMHLYLKYNAYSISAVLALDLNKFSHVSFMCEVISLSAGIFDTVDCHTLFLPATKKHLLQDLSKVY